MNNQFHRNKPQQLNRNDRDNNFTRINFQIRAHQVRVVRDGEQLGVMSTDQARRLAQEAGMDLVEVAPDARPHPVCHILEYSKYKFEQQKKEKDIRKKQREAQQEIKEIRLRPKIGDHDIETKARNARTFLEDGKKVLVVLQFRNREMQHKEIGWTVIREFLEQTKDVSSVEAAPRMDGNRLTCRLTPKTEDK